MTNVPTATIELLSKIQKEFLWGKNKSKIKHDTLCYDYEKCRHILKNRRLFCFSYFQSLKIV